MEEKVWQEAIELTSKLVAIPSENPGGSEEAMGVFVEEWLKAQQLPAEVQNIQPGRSNVISRIPGKGIRRPVILLAHMDTVPAGEGWSFSPFSGEIRNDRLLGRGSTDMKGGLGAAMLAFREISRRVNAPSGDLILAATADEEAGMRGILSLLESRIITRDMTAICTEPSGLCLCPAHKGVMWYKIVVNGKMVHAGNAMLGADSNRAAARIILALEEKITSLPYRHALLGSCTFTVGELLGGIKVNVVPDKTVIKVDFRAVPPLTVEEADRIVEEASREAVKDIKYISVTTERISLPRPPVETALTSPVVSALKEAFHEVMHEEIRVKSFPAYTDAAMAQWRTGLADSIVFGPGELEDAHTIDESVDIEQLSSAAQILYLCLTRLLHP